MEFLKKTAAYIAFLTILIAIAIYGIPKFKDSGNTVTDAGTTQITNTVNAVK